MSNWRPGMTAAGQREHAVYWCVAKLGDADVAVRRSAARTLGELADHAAAPALIAALGDPDYAVRGFAALALGELGEGQKYSEIGPWGAWACHGYLRVGCEVNTFADWIEHADAIDAKHGSPGLAAQTRALAQKLIAAQT